MTRKSFLGDVLFVQGLNILIKAIWILVIDRIIQNLLPTSEYGTYFGLLSFTILFIIILDLGFNNLNAKSVARDIDYYRENFAGFIFLKLIMAVLFAALVLGTAAITGYDSGHFRLLLLLIGFQVFISFNLYLRSNISASHLFKLDGILSVTDRLFSILVLGSWLFFEQYNHLITIENFIMVQLIGTMLTFVLGIIFNLTFLGKVRWKLHLPDIKLLLKKSAPYALLAALMAFYTRIDAVMVQNLLGEVETDKYAMAYRLLDAGNMIAVLLAGMLLPMFSRLQDKAKEIGLIVRTSTGLLVVPAMVFAIMVAVHPNVLLELMYPQKLALIAPETFSWLMFSFVSVCMIYIFGTLLTAQDDLKYLNLLALGCAIGNVVLNIILIPMNGIEGAAFATWMTQSVFAAFCVHRARRYLTFESKGKILYQSVISLAAFSLVFYFTKQFFEMPLVHMAIGVVLSVVIVVTSGLVSLETLKRMSRRKTQEPSDF